MFVALLSNRDKNRVAGRTLVSGGVYREGCKEVHEHRQSKKFTYSYVIVSRSYDLIEHVVDTVSVH